MCREHIIITQTHFNTLTQHGTTRTPARHEYARAGAVQEYDPGRGGWENKPKEEVEGAQGDEVPPPHPPGCVVCTKKHEGTHALTRDLGAQEEPSNKRQKTEGGEGQEPRSPTTPDSLQKPTDCK